MRWPIGSDSRANAGHTVGDGSVARRAAPGGGEQALAAGRGRGRGGGRGRPACSTPCPSPRRTRPTPADLRRRILDSAAQPWVGLAEATGRIALPELPALESTTALFTGVTRVRGHVAGPDRWRADELTPVGERDVYRLDGREYVWDFGFDQLTALSGNAALRLPRAADLLPPELGRRLLGLAPDDPVAPLPARRVAGRVAAGCG